MAVVSACRLVGIDAVHVPHVPVRGKSIYEIRELLLTDFLQENCRWPHRHVTDPITDCLDDGRIAMCVACVATDVHIEDVWQRGVVPGCGDARRQPDEQAEKTDKNE